jgi:hypothetical protein
MEVKGMSVKSTVAAQFERVAAEQQRKLAPLSDDLKLLDSGLDSLSFALIVRGAASRDIRRFRQAI